MDPFGSRRGPTCGSEPPVFERRGVDVFEQIVFVVVRGSNHFPADRE